MKVVKYYLEGLGTRGFWLVNWCKFRVGRYISWWTCSFLVFQTSSFMVKSLSTMPLFITTCPTGGLHPRFVIGDQHPKYGWTSKRTMEQTWNHEPRRVSTKFQVCSASKKWTLKRHPRQFGTTCSIFVAWAKKKSSLNIPKFGLRNVVTLPTRFIQPGRLPQRGPFWNPALRTVQFAHWAAAGAQLQWWAPEQRIAGFMCPTLSKQ